MNSSSHAQQIQARSLPTPLRKIGMDMDAPFIIYVDDVEFATFDSESEADAVYIELRKKMKPTVFGGAMMPPPDRSTTLVSVNSAGHRGGLHP